MESSEGSVEDEHDEQTDLAFRAGVPRCQMPFCQMLDARPLAPQDNFWYHLSTMKIVLLDDVAKLGQKLDVKDVAPGYARNFLLPQGLAELATEGTLRQLEARRTKIEADLMASASELDALVASLDGKTLTLVEKANEEGHLFAGVHEAEILSALEKEHGIKLPKSALSMKHPIKVVGETVVNVRGADKEIGLKVVIEREA